MSSTINPDLCIIGGGSAGLSLAAGAAQMGAETVLIEAGKMGGDCLNYGCVPSKSLIACAKAAKNARSSGPLGVTIENISVDMSAVRDHVRNVIKTIEPHDSVERFEGLGVTVIEERGTFLDGDTVKAGDVEIKARRFAVATGSRPAIPPIKGMEEVGYLTNETIFDCTDDITHLLVIGAGPIGCELAQAYARLGVKVSLIDVAKLLPREDDEVRQLVASSLAEDGVEILEETSISDIKSGPTLVVSNSDVTREIKGSHILVATGRQPNVDAIGLENCGIDFDRRGIKVDARLRTTNRRVYAIGDCNGISQFTHAAGYQAGVALKNILLRLPSKANAAMPRVTFTDPEIAFVGQTDTELNQKGIDFETIRMDFSSSDRALADAHTKGFSKISVSPSGKVLGATVVGYQAGEQIVPWIHAVDGQLKLSQIASTVMPYPTYPEINKRVAGKYFQPKIFNDKIRLIVRLLSKLG